VALVEREQPPLPLTRQAELLSLSRSGLYYVPTPVSAAEVAIKHAIDEIYTQYPFYGSRRITVELRNQRQLRVARETVQRYMREMGIAAIYPGPNLSRHNPEHKVYPYLLRNVTAAYPNHVWGIDITYIRLRGGWLYLVAVIDWFSRYVVSWELDQTLEMPFVVTAVERAVTQATPVIWNSDQGSHFTSPQYTQLLLNAGVQISMDGKGRASDNIFTERFWRTLKYELDFGSDITLGAEGLENARKSGNRTGSEVQFWLQTTRDLPRQVALARQRQAPVQRRCLQA